MTSPDDISSMPTDMESCHPHHCDNSNSPSLGSSKKTATLPRPPSLHLPKTNTITFPSPPSSSSLASPPSFGSFDFGAFQLVGYQHETREPLQTMEPITVPPSSTESSPQGSISEMEPVTLVTISRPGPGASDSGIFLPLSPSILTKPSYDPILPSIESKTPSVDLEKNCEEPLPPKRHHRFVRHARHTFFNVYRRLFTTVFMFNIIGLAILLARNHHWITSPPLSDFATAASANILVALLVRQDYIVNLLFRLTWFVPHSAPLRLRRILAKVYEYGGVHSGAAVSSVLWFTLLTAFLTNSYVKGAVEPDPAAIITFSYLLLALLLASCITAYPRFRFKSHNTFENVHRFAGWFSLALFWAEIILFARTQLTSTSAPLGIILIRLPAFWFLLIASLHTIAPWLRLHRVAVTPEKLSDHAIRLHFKEKVPLFVGLRISDSPLREWHSFACIPSRDGGKSGGSVLISDAGDWTRKTIRNPKPYYYLKGVPVTGVLCMAQIFKRVVIVTTGSGIGPCLGVMQDIPQTKCRVIWSTPTPELVYGKNICEAVRHVDKEAVVWDTRERGRPDLVEIAWRVFTEMDAEAVFVISNPKLTRKVVYGMEARSVPAFGPIWDS